MVFFINKANHWYAVTITPDLYNKCHGHNGVPVNYTNCYQQPRSGSGYAGFFNYDDLGGVTEYLGVHLKKQLSDGQQYYIRFFVVSRNCKWDTDKCFADGFELAFSDTAQYYGLLFPGWPNSQFIPELTPAIEHPRNMLIRDTVVWQKVSGCYVGKGWETHAVIGNYMTNEQTLASPGCSGGSAYYYIDDVGVFAFDPLPDTILLCENKAIKIGERFLDSEYSWNTGETDSVITIEEAGQYIVHATIDGCILSDTVEVVSIQTEVDDLMEDTSFCQNEGPLSLEFSIPGTYQWSGNGT